MNYLLIITLVSAICSILGFFSSKWIKSRRWLWLVVVFILTFASGFTIHYSSKLERIKNVHKQANAICNHHNPYGSNKAFIQEALVFLEENKDLYPDAYKRAVQIYSDVKESKVLYESDATSEMFGIIKGIATLNEE